MTQEDRDRYKNALHAVQTGVKTMMHIDYHDLKVESLRVGVNSAMCDSVALAKLLMDKGIFTQDEYEKYIADEMEREVERYQQRIERHIGRKVGLA